MAAMTEPDPGAGRRHRRPFALYALVGLMVLKVVLIVGATIGTARLEEGESVVRDALRIPGLARAAETFTILDPLLLGIAATLLLSVGGLLAGRHWGWLLAMVTAGIFVAIDIVAFAAGAANYLWMLLNIVTVFYLNQREIREGMRDPAAGQPDAGAAR